MKKFIHLRGSMAVGKTTAAREFVKHGNFKEKQMPVGKKQYPYLYDEERNIVITGKYDDRTCGGLDGRIEDSDIMLEYLLRLCRYVQPEYIIFEAVMYGCTVKFAENIASAIKKFGYEYVGLCFLPPLDVAIERVYKRNGGKQIKMETFVRKYGDSERSYLRLKEKGFNVKHVDTSKIAQADMWQIIQREIDEVGIKAD